MDKKSFVRQLQDYQEKVKDWLKLKEEKSYKNLYADEENTTVKFVIPLFNILGWNHLSRDMELECVIKGKEFKKPRYVDIALYPTNSTRPKILVEIKRIQADEFGTGRQLLRYLHAKKIKYGIYTNGREIRLIDNRTPTKYIPEALFILKVEDFVNYSKVLSVLSKESVEMGHLDNLAKCYHSKEFWESVKNEESKVIKRERQNLKYRLRLEYANTKLSVNS